MHSLNAGKQSAFAKVLEYPLLAESSGEIDSSMMGNIDGDGGGGDGEMDGLRRPSAVAAVMMRRRSRKLFQKLSSRVSKSKPR